MNMPLTEDVKVHFSTTLFALIRENLSIKMRAGKNFFLIENSLTIKNKYINTGNLTV